MTEKRTTIDLIAGQQIELRSPRGTRVSYPLGSKTNPKAVLVRDLGTWVEPVPPEPPPTPEPEPEPVPPTPPTTPPVNLQEAINDSSAGSTLVLSGATYTGSYRVTKPLIIVGGTFSRGAAAGSGHALHVTSDDVTIRAARIKGGGNGIWAESADGVTNGFLAEDNVIEDVGYSGIMVISGKDCIIRRNTVRRIGLPYVESYHNNAYGISASRYAGYPPSTDILIAENIIEDHYLWQALDTHDGVRVRFEGNTIRRCRRAIFITYANSSPTDTRATGNFIEAPMSKWPVAGGDVSGISFYKATGGIATGNTIKGMPSPDRAVRDLGGSTGLVLSPNTIG